MRLIKSILVLCIFTFILSCSEQPEQKTIRLGINPWPGYEFLYLADQKGFFKEEGIDIELLELASLADIKRVFEQGRIDAMASTIVEAVEVSLNSDKKIDILLVPDFSNGADVIIANDHIESIADLKGKKIGVELGLLGSFILSQALNQHRLSLDDVSMVNVEQLNAESELIEKNIAAMVTYPPFSTEILRQDKTSQIFSTKDIPGDVIDVVVITENALINPLEWQKKFFNSWQRAIDYAKSNQQDAYQIMAEREGITVEEFKHALAGVQLIEQDEQLEVLTSKQLKMNILKVCQTLNTVNKTGYDCNTIHHKLGSLGQ